MCINESVNEHKITTDQKKTNVAHEFHPSFFKVV